MKTLLIVIGLILSSCGKQIELPKIDAASPTTTTTTTSTKQEEEKKASEVVKHIPTAFECHKTSPGFLDVQSAALVSVLNADGTKDVTCTLIDGSGNAHTKLQHYDSDSDPGLKYFSFCRIYYVRPGGIAYNITFNLPGYYNVGTPDLSPIDTGFQLSGMPEYPSDGLGFSASMCAEKK